jgi:hypothetical protein
MPSPQTPLWERPRGFENLQLFLAPLLLLWEKGLGDEGKDLSVNQVTKLSRMDTAMANKVISAVTAVANFARIRIWGTVQR